MNESVGTWAWSRETGGVLRRQDKIELLRLGGLLGLHLPALAVYRLHLQPWRATKPDSVGRTTPDGDAATSVHTRLTDLAPPYLVNHSMRTYWLSRDIAAAMHRDFDDELLFVASLAHDVGLLDTAEPEADQYPCFAIRGARWAVDIARAVGWNETRVERLGDVITLNLNGTVPARRGIEARSMMMGVLADVTGIHRWRVHPEAVRALYTEFPVLDQDPRLATLFSSEANRHVHCRGHFAIHRLGFGWFMKHAPSVAVIRDPAGSDA